MSIAALTSQTLDLVYCFLKVLPMQVFTIAGCQLIFFHHPGSMTASMETKTKYAMY